MWFFLCRASPPPPVLIQFDPSLSEDTLGNKLQPNSLTVDNLTVDWLRTRLTDIETAIKECQDKQSRLIATDPTSTSVASGAGNTSNGSLNTSFSISLFNHSHHTKELNTLRCQERQLLKSADTIRSSLNEVGCEELPSGCDDLSVDIIDNAVDSTDIQPVSLLENQWKVTFSIKLAMAIGFAPKQRLSASQGRHNDRVAADTVSAKIQVHCHPYIGQRIHHIRFVFTKIHITAFRSV